MKRMELIEQGRFLGEEFVLWLWMRGLTEGGTSGLDGDFSACFVDDAVQLVSERGDVKDIRLSKGNPAESREAFEAISRGLRPARAKFRMLAGDMEWTFSLDAANLQLVGMHMPPTQSKDPAGRVADRLFLLEEGKSHLERRFKAFLDARVDGDVMESHLQEWVKKNLSGIQVEELPWEE